MVSFQCDGCSDVVKKPKLDQHGSRCHASFTCLDCSKTFGGPSEWRSHTSCISEAEKYEKSIYRGPNIGRGGGQTGRMTGRGRGAGGPQRPQNNRQFRPYSGTGSNETPLGTPKTRSPLAESIPIKPVTTAAIPETEPSKPEKSKNKKKESNDGIRALVPVLESSSISDEAAQPPEQDGEAEARKAEKKRLKKEKRKAEEASAGESDQKRKKSKQAEDTDSPATGTTEQAQSLEKLKVKKSKKSKRTEELSTPEPASAIADSDDAAQSIDTTDQSSAKEKRKKRKREGVTDEHVAEDDSENVKKKLKKEKKKKEKEQRQPAMVAATA